MRCDLRCGYDLGANEASGLEDGLVRVEVLAEAVDGNTASVSPASSLLYFGQWVVLENAACEEVQRERRDEVLGDGPVDLAPASGFVSCLEAVWAGAAARRRLTRVLVVLAG